jgi:hypothetical protein
VSESQSDVMHSIELVSKQHVPDATTEKAIATFMESSFGDYWRDRFYKARPDAPDYEIVSKAAPVAGGERGAILSDAMWEQVTKDAQNAGIPVTEAWERFKTTSEGAVLLAAYQDAVRS